MEEDLDSNKEMEVDSSDSDDSNLEDEAENDFIKRTEELERQIADNKYDYNAHEELVKLYHKLSDLKSMRLAYKRFHEYFPLTPEIWLEWISVEKSLASSENERNNIFSLFDKAVDDYLSVKLWMEYAQYSIGASDLQTTRSILERGLTAAGLHCAQGSLLWDTLRELELAHLSLEKEGSAGYTDQVNRIVEVFRRQLSVPLIGMESTYDEFKQFLEILPNSTIKTEPVEWGYKKALKTLSTYKTYEDKLLSAPENDQLTLYREYIATVTDPSTVLCLYERASTQLCLNAEIWLEYCTYAFKLGPPAEKASMKALRNCPWSEDLWLMRLRVLEHSHADESEILACFEQGISQLGQSLSLWLGYLDYSRRNFTPEKFYKLCEQAVAVFQHEADPTCKVSRFYARVLAKNGKILDARRVWKAILKIPQNKAQASVWIEFINLEKQYGGGVNALQEVFQRAVKQCTDWPQCVAEEWMMFERENGTLADILNCENLCREILKKQPVINTINEKNLNKRPAEESPVKETKTKRVKEGQGIFQAARKTPVVKDPAVTVFISNLYPSITEKRLKTVFPNSVNIELVVDRLGKSRCYGYVQFSAQEEVMTALARDREELDGRPIFISNCKPDRTERKSSFKYSNEVEKNKLFVKGLPVEKTQEEIETVFKPFGALTVRLVRHKSGQSKGLAYVEFPDEELAKQAMQKTDQMKIGIHTVSVAISAPPTKNKNGEAGQGQGQGHAAPARNSKSRLQVPLVPRALQVKPAGSGSGAGNEEVRTKAKSNADFRKMLLK